MKKEGIIKEELTHLVKENIYKTLKVEINFIDNYEVYFLIMEFITFQIVDNRFEKMEDTDKRDYKNIVDFYERNPLNLIELDLIKGILESKAA